MRATNRPGIQGFKGEQANRILAPTAPRGDGPVHRWSGKSPFRGFATLKPHSGSFCAIRCIAPSGQLQSPYCSFDSTTSVERVIRPICVEAFDHVVVFAPRRPDRILPGLETVYSMRIEKRRPHIHRWTTRLFPEPPPRPQSRNIAFPLP